MLPGPERLPSQTACGRCWRGSSARTRSPSTLTSGCRCRWAPACCSPATPTSSRRPFGSRRHSCQAPSTTRPIRTPPRCKWSRRFAGLKIFLALAAVGRVGYAEQIDRDTALGAELARRLTDDGWELVNRTPLPVVCFTDPGARTLKPQAASEWHDRVAQHVVASGEAWISPAHLAGAPALRACITSYRTTRRDIDRLVTALASARDNQARTLSGGSP